MARVRADQLLVDRGLVDSRERAQRMVMAGQVRTGDRVLVKPATMLAPDDPLELIESPRYVSRGGYKLEAALEAYDITLNRRRCMDVGASTGGFTDCMLQYGASSVLAVDVGRSQIHQVLREDSRVTLLEHTNARELPSITPIDFFAIDVSFISLRKVLPAVASRVRPATEGVLLLKPQFELEPSQVPPKGVIRDDQLRNDVAAAMCTWLEERRWKVLALDDCPVAGSDGNVEFLLHVRTPGAGARS